MRVSAKRLEASSRFARLKVKKTNMSPEPVSVIEKAALSCNGLLSKMLLSKVELDSRVDNNAVKMHLKRAFRWPSSPFFRRVLWRGVNR